MLLLRPIARLAVLTALAAAPAAAQSPRRLFVWTGRVDREAILVMRGRDLDARVDDRDDRWRGRGRDRDRDRDRERVVAPLPRAAGVVTLAVDEGRGRVQVLQQPSARNDWTTIVRVRDERGGDDRYRVVAFWEPVGGGDWGWGRGRGRDDDRWDDRRDGRWDDRRDRDDDRDHDRRACARDDWGCIGRGDDRADGRAELRWRGEVDDEAELRIQGRRVDVVTSSGAGTRDVSTRVAAGGLPARDVAVRVRTLDGRGDVRLVQQPSQWNGWTAIVRVRDPQGGFGRYDLALDW